MAVSLYIGRNSCKEAQSCHKVPFPSVYFLPFINLYSLAEGTSTLYRYENKKETNPLVETQYRFAVFNFTLNPKNPVNMLMKVLRIESYMRISIYSIFVNLTLNWVPA